MDRIGGLGLWALVASIASGCVLNDGLKNRCHTSADCERGNVCESGYCVAEGSLPDAGAADMLPDDDMHCAGDGCPCTPQSCAANGQRCDTTTHQCAACLPPEASDMHSHVYVGSDAATAAAALPYCPYGSITAALHAVAGATTPVTIHVGPGTYDQQHETFPLTVRGPVTLLGAGPDKTIIAGYGPVALTADTAINFASNATLQVGDTNQTVRLSGFSLNTGTTSAFNNTNGIFCDQGNAPESGAPNTLVDNLDVGPGYTAGIVVTNSTNSACNFKLTGSRIHDSGRGVWVLGCGFQPPSSKYVAATIGGTGPGEGNDLSQILGAKETTNDIGFAITAWDCTAALVIEGNQIHDSGGGFVSGTHNRALGVVVSGNRFTNLLTSGITGNHSFNIEELSNNIFSGIRGGFDSTGSAFPAALALRDAAQVLLARGNRFIGNNIGVYIDGDALSADRVIDFGTNASFGNNVFSCNHALDGAVGVDFWVHLSAGGGSALPLVGNQWDHQLPIASSTAVDGTDLVNDSVAPMVALLTDHSSVVSMGACP